MSAFVRFKTIDRLSSIGPLSDELGARVVRAVRFHADAWQHTLITRILATPGNRLELEGEYS